MAESMFQNVAYRATVYRTGYACKYAGATEESSLII